MKGDTPIYISYAIFRILWPRAALTLRCAGCLAGRLALKRYDDMTGHGGGTLADKLRQRGQRAGRWWSTDARFPVRSGGYDIEQVNQWLERLASLGEKGFAPARYTPPDGFNRWWRGRGDDAAAVDRYLAGLPGEAAAAGLCVLPAPPPPPNPFYVIGDALQRKGDAEWRRFESDRTSDWQRIGDLPGVRLIRRSLEITSTTGEVLLTRHRRTMTLTSGQGYRAVTLAGGVSPGPRASVWERSGLAT
jgi:hypothetical protein